MTLIEVVLLGLALSADAFSVTISNTFTYCEEPKGRLLLMPLFFGLFQALMPLLGYFLGSIAASLIEAYAGVVTLVILGIIGGNMIREGAAALIASRRSGGGNSPSCDLGHRLTLSILTFQAIATAIDAFAVGVSLRAQTVNLAFSVTTIGLTTALCCVLAIVMGKKLGVVLGDRAELIGGVVLVAIGIKAFIGM